MNKLFINLILFTLLLSPFSIIYGAGGLVPCDGPDCNIASLIKLAQTVLQFILGLAVSIATLMIAYAGYLYLTAQGKDSEIEKAKKIFIDVIIGFVVALAGYLIVKFILGELLDEVYKRSGFIKI